MMITGRPDGQCDVTQESPHTRQFNTLTLPVSYDRVCAYASGTDGRLVQVQFPELTPDQREFLMTGYTAEDWAAMFPPDPAEEAIVDRLLGKS